MGGNRGKWEKWGETGGKGARLPSYSYDTSVKNLSPLVAYSKFGEWVYDLCYRKKELGGPGAEYDTKIRFREKLSMAQSAAWSVPRHKAIHVAVLDQDTQTS